MQRAHDILTGTAGRLFPTTGFNFQGKGAVSPSEFIIAGDAIVATDRRWEWVSDYIGTPLECLPRDKQFLRAYDIPCMVLPKLVTRDVGEWTLCDAILDGGDQESSPTQGAQTANFADTDDCANNLYDSGTSNRPERRYDISITYDQYYETPRIWLIGFNAVSIISMA
ncbi:autophagy-related 3-like [Babesia ovis]|uniref:Autophagy-related 3-like n=1 Tax=Babesia ovis TaxID=5869 RepID=A0A9W5TAK6_BABOV|nr:autophagy-related 3-like [Babesia ovis]